ncbi:zinc finger protein 883-like [Phlebotomus argentipes]|uniref:zinc finger protein 883-like n=1 Tax=Phlebotomus argentipes TaxID=94469 RepID=UPI0028933C3B|nr:zinc finger protein 883-like [Phlebotomus argentipes]
MTTPVVEFCTVNNITVTIPVSSLLITQQVPVLPDRKDAEDGIAGKSQITSEPLNINSKCDTAETPGNTNIPKVECDQVFEARLCDKEKSWRRRKRSDDKCLCFECLDSFSLISDLHKHTLKNHPSDSQNFHQCFFCPGKFADKDSLLRHVLVHESEEYHECPDCSAVFVEIGTFLHHMDNHQDKSGTLRVSNDEETVANPPESREEDRMPKVQRKRKNDAQGTLQWQKRDNKVRPFTCNLCDRSFTLASTMALHKKRTHLGIRPHECPKCGWKFAQSSDLTKHMRRHTGDRPYRCEFCGLAFTQLRNLKNHAKTHTEEPRSCKYCEKVFTIDTSLQAHLRKHEGSEAEPCEVCGVPFTQARDLEHHRRRHHRESRPHKCSSCDKRFGKKCDMIKHQRIHTGEKPFACSICQKSFTHPTSLRNHAAVHSGEKPFQCSVCGRAFAFAGNLKVHMRSHTGERPFECTVCQKTFSRSANLNEHLKIHTGEKSYRCDLCGKAFTNSSTFSKHKKIHSGVRPHSCPLCSKAFIQYAHLAKHLRIHTGEKPYKCTICGKFFRRTDTLASHMKTHRKAEHLKDTPSEALHFTFAVPADEMGGQVSGEFTPDQSVRVMQSQEATFDYISPDNSTLLITHL